jgi:hypothetical protein
MMEVSNVSSALRTTAPTVEPRSTTQRRRAQHIGSRSSLLLLQHEHSLVHMLTTATTAALTKARVSPQWPQRR